MSNSIAIVMVVGIVVIGALLLYSGVSLKREGTKYQKSEDALHLTGNRVWAHITPAQQEELKNIETLVEQEEWVERNIDPTLLNGLSPEKLLVFYANRGMLLLGVGPFRRHMSPVDYAVKAAQAKQGEHYEKPVGEQQAAISQQSEDHQVGITPPARKTKRVSYKVKKSPRR